MFDEKKAKRAVDFFEKYLTHTKGKWARKPFTLEMEWQKKLISDIFGTVTADGNRKYRKVYVEIPKKNGKSEIAAGIALKLLLADGEQGGQIYSAAADRQQASLVFDVAAQMVRNSYELQKRCKILDSQKRIICYSNNSFYHVLASDVENKHGFDTTGVIFDELHTQPNRKLYDVLTDGAGDARDQPLFFFITTAGFDRNSICWEVHQYAVENERRRLANDPAYDPTFYSMIFCLPEEASWEDPENWKKVNPSLGTTIKMKGLEDAYREAKENPAKQNNFRRLRLNQWTQQEKRIIPMDKWDLCAGEPINETELLGRSCYSGLDLALTGDITALVHWFPPDDWENGTHIILPRFWIAQNTMEKHIKKDHVPYDVWSMPEFGYMKTCPGDMMDYDWVLECLEEDMKKFNIVQLGFDEWGSARLIGQIQEIRNDEDFLVMIRQGFKSLQNPFSEFLRLVTKEKIRHGGNPVLRWMADNTVAATNPAGGIKPDKSKARNRIDGIVAAIMALSRAQVRIEAKSIGMEVW